MQLGKVVGKVISTNKAESLKSIPILIVERLNENMERLGETIACTETVQANQGDVVLVCQSSSSRKTDITSYVCTDASVVGIVDDVNLQVDIN